MTLLELELDIELGISNSTVSSSCINGSGFNTSLLLYITLAENTSNSPFPRSSKMQLQPLSNNNNLFTTNPPNQLL